MKSPACARIEHGAFRVLSVLVCGAHDKRNGRLELTERRAAEFGIKSHDLVWRSMRSLIDAGLVVVTRRVKRKARHPAHYAVTWWPIYFFEGTKLDKPEPARHSYLQVCAATSDHETPAARLRVSLTPTNGAVHPD